MDPAPRTIAPSPRLFIPTSSGTLVPQSPDRAPAAAVEKAAEINASIHALLSQKDYPCVAALSSLHHREFQVGVYGELGSSDFIFELGCDLANFLAEQKRSSLTYLTFWAVFPQVPGAAWPEEGFEKRLWRQLSALSAVPEFEAPWDPRCSDDPADRRFGFSFAGKALFVVGLHPASSRLSRRFKYPALVFNAFEQFDTIMREGRYQKMVDINRDRDVKFQGDVNPMAQKYGEQWEAIQFSGRDNPPHWKCPFRK